MKQIKAASQEEVFQNLPIPAALRVMIVPAVTSQLIVLIYNMADTFYVDKQSLYGGQHLFDPPGF